MATLHELSTLSCLLPAIDEASAGARAWTEDAKAKGELLGAWHVDIGVLGRLPEPYSPLC